MRYSRASTQTKKYDKSIERDSFCKSRHCPMLAMHLERNCKKIYGRKHQWCILNRQCCGRNKVHQDHNLEQHGGNSFKGTRHRKAFIKLHSPLGNWTNLTRRTWAAYYSATNNSIRVQHRTGSLQWNRYTVLKQHRRHLELADRELDRSESPQDREPVDYYPE